MLVIDAVIMVEIVVLVVVVLMVKFIFEQGAILMSEASWSTGSLSSVVKIPFSIVVVVVVLHVNVKTKHFMVWAILKKILIN